MEIISYHNIIIKFMEIISYHQKVEIYKSVLIQTWLLVILKENSTAQIFKNSTYPGSDESLLYPSMLSSERMMSLYLLWGVLLFLLLNCWLLFSGGTPCWRAAFNFWEEGKKNYTTPTMINYQISVITGTFY